MGCMQRTDLVPIDKRVEKLQTPQERQHHCEIIQNWIEIKRSNTITNFGNRRQEGKMDF